MPGPITIRVTTPVIKYMLFLIENANFIVYYQFLQLSSTLVPGCQGLEYWSLLIVCLRVSHSKPFYVPWPRHVGY